MSDNQLFMVGVGVFTLLVSGILSILFQVNKYVKKEEAEMVTREKSKSVT